MIKCFVSLVNSIYCLWWTRGLELPNYTKPNESIYSKDKIEEKYYICMNTIIQSFQHCTVKGNENKTCILKLFSYLDISGSLFPPDSTVVSDGSCYPPKSFYSISAKNVSTRNWILTGEDTLPCVNEGRLHLSPKILQPLLSKCWIILW